MVVFICSVFVTYFNQGDKGKTDEIDWNKLAKGEYTVVSKDIQLTL